MVLIKFKNNMPDTKSSGFTNFKLYCMCKAHFSSDSFDINKYNAINSKIKRTTFLARNDRFFFNRIAERYTLKQNMIIFCFAIINDINANIIDMNSDTALETARKHIRIINDIENVYRKDIITLRDYCNRYEMEFCDLLDTNRLILRLMMKGYITAETFILLDSFLGIIDRFDKTADDMDLLWENVRTRLNAFKGISDINKDKAQHIFNEVIKHENL